MSVDIIVELVVIAIQGIAAKPDCIMLPGC